MGKGTIISHTGDGQYQVSVIYNTDRAQAEKAANLTKIADIETQIEEKETEQEEVEAEITALVSEIKIENTKPEPNQAIIENLEKDLAEKRIEKETIVASINVLKLQKLSLEKRNETLDAIPETETITAWCADLTEDLTGEVGLIEVPGESTAFNIQPGYEGNAAYNAARDGQLTPTLAMTPAAAFYNLAMLPGWQKWKPTYRYGTITSIDGDLADVSLDAATSTQQSLGVNQASTLTGVPIEYMSCNGAAFEVGDEVLVKFTGQDWGNPLVVGFKDNPEPCEIPFYIRIKFNGTAPGVGGERIYFEYPDDPVGNYEKTYIVPAGGLMGPYIHGTDPASHAIDGTKISLFWNRAQAPIRPIFHYFTAVASGSATYCTDIGYSTGDTGNNQLNIELNAMPATGQRYYQKVFRIKPGGSIFDLPMTIETIGGVDYPVYTADFTVKMIRRKNGTAYTAFESCESCAVETRYLSLSAGNGYLESTDGDYGNWPDYQGISVSDCETDPYRQRVQEDFGEDLVSDTASLDSIVIVTDANGLTPTFTDFDLVVENRVDKRVNDEGGNPVCTNDATLVTNDGYEMINSPDIYL